MTMPLPNSGETNPTGTPADAGQADNTGGGTTGGQPEGGITEASREDLLEEIKKLRTESAARRVENRKAKTELQQFEEWKRSQMSEAERLKLEVEEAKKSAMSAYVDVYAERYNVPEERRQFISGGSKEEIENACKVLGEAKPDTPSQPTGKPAPNLFPGTNGTALGSRSGGTDFDEILRQQLRK